LPSKFGRGVITRPMVEAGAVDARKAASQHRYIALDGLRGVAAGMVLLGHIGTTIHRSNYFNHSGLAVDLFFVLSGFVLAGAYEPRLATSRSPALDMLRIRLVRLWPTMALGSTLALAMAAVSPTNLAGLPLALAYLHELTFIPVLRPGANLFLLNGVEWSLFFELLANLTHALLLRRLGVRALGLIVAISGALLCLAVITAGSISLGWRYEIFPAGFARVTFSYCAGVMLFRLRDRGPRLRLPTPLLLAAPVIGVGLPLVTSSAFGDLANVFILFPLLVWAGQAAPGPKMTRISMLAGEISYPLYAIQFPLIAAWEVFAIHNLRGGAEKTVAWLAFPPLIALVALAVSRWYDLPTRKLLGRMLAGRGMARAEAAAKLS
jgi:peptidoglycan/LPS O-acetylase OafA/YrhL